MSFTSQQVLPAILMVRDHLPECYWRFLCYSTQKTPDMEGSERKIRDDGTGRHPFILIDRDCFFLTSNVNFIKAVRDPFIQQQFHAIVWYILESMIRDLSIEAFIHGPSLLEPIIILNLLDLSEEVKNEPNEFRRNAYFQTVFNTIVNWLDPRYPR